MKNQKQLYLSILLLQVFLMTSANAFAFSPSSISSGSPAGEFLKVEQNKKAVLSEENISQSRIEISLENENDLHSFQPENASNFNLKDPGLAKLVKPAFLPNRKEQLKKLIFPFHYFW